MLLTQRQQWRPDYLARLKSFLIWSFTLAVCLLVVGFPLVFLMATIAVLATVVLQFVLPTAAVLLVAGGILGSNILIVLLGAAILTIKGIHPEEVRWLHWLHGNSTEVAQPRYAACPLTCGLGPSIS
ncbi:MAG: hypothetical protein AAGG51_26040 [Cyanobacteria bacterium P01_G01_bin.54]